MKHPFFQKVEMICERIYLVGMGLVIAFLIFILFMNLNSNDGISATIIGLGVGFLIILEILKTFVVWIFSGQVPRLGTVVTRNPETS